MASVHKVTFERHLAEGPPTPQGNAFAIAIGAQPGQPVQWEWRCSCGASGSGPHELVTAAGRQHEEHAAPPVVVHIRSQEGQPYGSERRCCNECGVMLWGSSSPPYVESWTDWRALPNRCGLERKASE